MANDGQVAPIIIKRKKVSGGDGHHGGAWKVAYADFVTAMMAFFMLMWLLNATTEKQRKGIADYFSPTIPINRVSGGGDGDFGGESVFSEEVLPQMGTGASHRRPTEERQARGNTGTDRDGDADGKGDDGEDAQFAKIEEALMGLGGESTATEDPLKHIVTKVTDEGLVIELFELPGVPLFDAQGEPTEMLLGLAGLLAQASALVENEIAVEGHVASKPVVVNDVDLWADSTRRAGQLRALLQARGVDDDRVRRVTGHADREHVLGNPLAVRNNRMEFILLRSDRN